ncbi:hypothetical protein DXT95_23130 [Agrobacterium tumefaciens]|nr:hypothetical protein [Agrobacterium tumefaciens]
MQKTHRQRTGIFALGAVGLLLAVISSFAYTGLVSTPNVGTKVAKVGWPVGQELAAATTRPRDSVDIALVTPNTNETEVAAPPFVAIPTKRPTPEAAKAKEIRKLDRSASKTSSADVLPYDRCNPICETRDPLIIGALPAAFQGESGALDTPTPAAKLGASTLNGAGYVLARTAALPFTTLRLGRDVLIKTVDLE